MATKGLLIFREKEIKDAFDAIFAKAKEIRYTVNAASIKDELVALYAQLHELHSAGGIEAIVAFNSFSNARNGASRMSNALTVDEAVDFAKNRATCVLLRKLLKFLYDEKVPESLSRLPNVQSEISDGIVKSRENDSYAAKAAIPEKLKPKPNMGGSTKRRTAYSGNFASSGDADKGELWDDSRASSSASR